MRGSSAILDRIQDWYRNQCDGDWEHSYGVRIETLDNPGWIVTIELQETPWEHVVVPRSVLERSETDWLQSEVKDGKFLGSGGALNLEEVLSMFLHIVTTHSPPKGI